MRDTDHVKRICLHIGPDPLFARAIQKTACRDRDALAAGGTLYPQSLGRPDHGRLFLSALDPDHVDPLRAARGLSPEDRHATFQSRTQRALMDEIASSSADTILLSCDLAGRDLVHTSELIRLRDMLTPISTRIDIVAHIPPVAEALAAIWAVQIPLGRVAPLQSDLAFSAEGWATARTARFDPVPDIGLFPELELAPHWLDPAAFLDFWQSAFERVTLCRTHEETCAALGLSSPTVPSVPPSAQTLARILSLNPLIRGGLARGLILPRRVRARLATRIAISGPPLDCQAIDAALGMPAQTAAILPALTDFSPTEAMTALLPKMMRLTRAADIGRGGTPPAAAAPDPNSSLSGPARQTYARLVHSRYAPHNRQAPLPPSGAPFTPVAIRNHPTPERILIACVKDEAPYLLEWLAYHRLIGVDHFLIYSNDCSDGTDTMLDLLASQGWLTHIDNSSWHGKSPQQAALNHAITLPMVQAAQWIMHIDADEFVNIRCGNGTLDDLFRACPDATHFALTWRLFGSGGIDRFTDRLVLDQFARCAPAFCPKPHTAWGFKTLGRQIGVYGKLSCHRPTKPAEDRLALARWVNGSGIPMGPEIARRGWRSNIRTIGYDLVQLNHYALRSKDSFLIKRKRGRALHVDRTIGHNYWVRMDWNDHKDHAIQRNLPRLKILLEHIRTDPAIAAAHSQSVQWHRDRAAALRQDPDMQQLLAQIDTLNLSQSERAAFAMTLDMES